MSAALKFEVLSPEPRGAMLRLPERAPPPAAPGLSAAERATLEHIRVYARRAQIAPPIDVDRACSLIDPPAERAADVYGVALMRTLARGGRRMVFHPRGARSASAAESWLLRLLTALAQGDEASARFLGARWIDRADRRVAMFLARRLTLALLGELPKA